MRQRPVRTAILEQVDVSLRRLDQVADGASWECSVEPSAAVNVDAAMPPLQSSDEVQIRFKELWSNQEAWAVLEPAYLSEE